MLVNKITAGFVIQTFDTKTGKWVSQEFVADNQSEYENETGKPLKHDSIAYAKTFDAYLCFNMVQPSEAYPDAEC